MLNSKDKSELKSKAHMLHPVVMIADKGLTETVLNEINIALDFHGLIKIKIAVGDKEIKNGIVEKICKVNSCELIQMIGNILIIYRKPLKK